MRQIQYLSPTSISIYLKNKEEFYLNYLADIRQKRFPQTRPMSIGSAFDAFAKSFLYEKILGKNKDPRFDLITLFEAQVEPDNRTWALEHGKRVFEQYMQSGSLADLLHELEGSTTVPRFEIEVSGVVNGYREGITLDIGVPLLGKPDVHFINKEGASVILDWKVNGYCSDYNTSPMKGYVNIRELGKSGKCHKDALVVKHKGVLINACNYLEDINQDWARQLYIYGWLCGEEIGSDFITAIDQVVCNKDKYGGHPNLRFAQHRMKANSKYQFDLFKVIQDIWQVCTSGHFFTEMSLEDSINRCKLLEEQALSSQDLNDPFNQVTRY
jgi:hypothetical protein